MKWQISSLRHLYPDVSLCYWQEGNDETMDLKSLRVGGKSNILGKLATTLHDKITHPLPAVSTQQWWHVLFQLFGRYVYTYMCEVQAWTPTCPLVLTYIHMDGCLFLWNLFALFLVWKVMIDHFTVYVRRSILHILRESLLHSSSLGHKAWQRWLKEERVYLSHSWGHTPVQR